MSQKLIIKPPKNLVAYRPSDLFRFFFQLGRWTDESFSAQLQAYTYGKSVSTVTISKWKNRNVVPKRYAANLFFLINDIFEPEVAAEWRRAFEIVWAHHAVKPQNASLTSQITPEAKADAILQKHRAWIQTRYADRLMGERFSIDDIYVPLQLAEQTDASIVIYDPDNIKAAAVNGWASDRNKDVNWTFITGGPGSGKSIAALNLAQSLSDTEVFQIYLRVSHLSPIDMADEIPSDFISDSYSPDAFLKQFRASQYKTACLILDGLDEIGGTAQKSMEDLGFLVETLKSHQDVCQLEGKTLRIIALGREARTGHIAQNLSGAETKILHMLSLAGTLNGLGTIEYEAIGTDLRPLWWKKYLSAKKLPHCDVLPEFLSVDYNEFSEFGQEPLLAYLICSTAYPPGQVLEQTCPPDQHINQTTDAKNKNSIYHDIIEQVRRSDLWRPQRTRRPALDTNSFRKVLQYIALASWQSGGQRKASLKEIQNCIQDDVTLENFKALAFSTTGHSAHQADNMITAFYYRVHAAGSQNESNALEFTHKTFSEYLLATLFFDKFIRLIQTYGDAKTFEPALKDWIDICAEGDQLPSLADFCENEAKLRFASLSDLNWNAALNIISDNLSSYSIKHTTSLSKTIKQLKRASSLLFLIWGCLNKERHARSGRHFPLFEDPTGFSIDDLKRIQPVSPSIFNDSHNFAHQETQRTWLGHSLSGLQLKSAKLNLLQLSTGHISNISCQNTVFNMTEFARVKISNSSFIRSQQQQTAYLNTRLIETIFNQCLFRLSNFQNTQFNKSAFIETAFVQCHFIDIDMISCDFQNVLFDRCIFVAHHTSPQIYQTDLNHTRFRQCTFVNMDSFVATLPIERLETCNSVTQESERDFPNVSTPPKS